jgi:type I restriction enzyme M protein
MDRGQLEDLKYRALHGWEIVDSAARLCVMNLYLHGIGGDETLVRVDDSLRSHPGRNFDLVLTNPPFARSPASPSSTGRANRRGKAWSSNAPTSGPPPATSN